MLAALWGRVQGWLLMLGAALLVLVGSYAAGGRAAKKSAELDQRRRNAAARRKVDAVSEEFDSMGLDDLRRRARERMRKSKR